MSSRYKVTADQVKDIIALSFVGGVLLCVVLVLYVFGG